MQKSLHALRGRIWIVGVLIVVVSIGLLGILWVLNFRNVIVASAGLIVFVVGLFLFLFGLLLDAYLEAEKAKFGEGLGIFDAILGVAFLLLFLFLMSVLARPSLMLLGLDFGVVILVGIWLPLTLGTLYSVFRILSYFNQRRFRREMEIRRLATQTIYEWRFEIPGGRFDRISVLEDGILHSNLEGHIFPQTMFFRFSAISKVLHRRMAGGLEAYVQIIIVGKDFGQGKGIIIPTELFTLLRSVFEKREIELVGS